MGEIQFHYSQTYLDLNNMPLASGGREVNFTVTYNENASTNLYVGGDTGYATAYHVTSVTGSYSITDADGIVRTDTISTAGNFYDNITPGGTFQDLHFNISNVADTQDGSGLIDIYGINYAKHQVDFQYTASNSTYTGNALAGQTIRLTVVCF
ncbi:hypothetical protein, partial [Sphingomonas sp. GC_Shp_3]|uniref:hypothetical protein n=1 Tax=Sphingomonas sp. GC_Shp_3 TaxID=2937383 RepID=UPI0022699427